MASTGEVWTQWFTSCFHQSPQSPGHGGQHQRHQQQLNNRRQQLRNGSGNKTRLRIDRSMIGNPTNFVHTGHIGSADVELSSNHLNAIQTQMQSKGGYETNSLQMPVQAC